MFSPSKENNREDHLRKGAEVSPWESVVAGSMSGAVSRYVFLNVKARINY